MYHGSFGRPSRLPALPYPGDPSRAIHGVMSRDIELGCRCGEIHGWVRGVSPGSVNRAICYCDDCQAFLHRLERTDLFEPHSGTEVVQVAPRTVSFDRGTGHILALRLTAKGLHRWYASCCKTPLGNTATPSIPFIGMPLEVFRGAPDVRSRDEAFGPVRGASFGKFATDGAPESSPSATFLMIAHALRLVLGWKLRGKAWPHPFFDRASGTPIYKVTTLSSDEREALRARCGPNPTGVTTSAS